MKLSKLFQSKSANRADEILASLRQGASRERLTSLLDGVTQQVIDSLATKAEKGSQDDRDHTAIFKAAYNGLQQLEKGNDQNLSGTIGSIVSFRTYKASQETFGLATAAARVVAEKRNGNGGFYSKNQADAISMLGEHFDYYSREVVGSGSAGYANRALATEKFIEASKAYAGFNYADKSRELAERAVLSVLKQGHGLTESQQQYVNAKLGKTASGLGM